MSAHLTANAQDDPLRTRSTRGETVLHRWTRAALAASLTLVLTSTAQAASVSAGDLRIDNRADQPLGVDDTSPVLSWKLTGSGAAAKQTAYEVEATANGAT